MAGTEQHDPEFIVIFNPGSGAKEDDINADAIERAFAERGRKALVREVRGAKSFEDAVAEAERLGASCVVAAGGDGTISGTANKLVGKDLELGVLPLGTFNYFARRFDIPLDLSQAVDVVCGGETRDVHIGTVNDRVFINNASLGLYPSVLQRREQTYKRWGRSRLAAYWSVLVAMITVYRPMSMRITVDGRVERKKSPSLFVSVSDFQLDHFDLEGSDAIRDGRFAVLLAPDTGRYKLIWKALKIALRGMRKGRDYALLQGRDIIVETRQSPRLLARDGERERLAGPYEFRLLVNGLRVRVPSPEAGEGEGP